MRQQSIPGTEEKVPAAVRAAGEAYVSEAAKTARAKKKSDEAKEVLLAAMEKHEVFTFKDTEASPPVIITRTERHGVKVSKLKRPQDAEGDESGDVESDEA